MTLERRLAKLEAGRGGAHASLVHDGDESEPTVAWSAGRRLGRAPGETCEAFRARVRATWGPLASLAALDRSYTLVL